MLRVIVELDDVEGKSIKYLSSRSKLKESTINNILHDLDQFGLTTTEDNNVLVSDLYILSRARLYCMLLLLLHIRVIDSKNVVSIIIHLVPFLE